MFSIIIPTYNNLACLKICIKSIQKNSKYKHEIIVHVNEGKDGTINFLKKKKIPYSWTSKNVGLCKAVNLAAKKSKKNYIVYSHDDFYFCPYWDKYFFQEIKKINHNKFYLSGTMIDTFNGKKFFCGETPEKFNEEMLLQNYKKIKLEDFQGSTWAPHVVHKEVWNRVGGFSEEFFPGAGSDPDFAMKLWNINNRIFKGLGKSLVYHFGSRTLRNNNNILKKKNLGSNSGKIFIKKWGISIKFFKKYYLHSGAKYISKLNDPKKNFRFLFEYILCKVNFIYLQFFFKKLNIKS